VSRQTGARKKRRPVKCEIGSRAARATHKALKSVTRPSAIAASSSTKHQQLPAIAPHGPIIYASRLQDIPRLASIAASITRPFCQCLWQAS
jgi:hypothetical protein